MGPTEVLPWRKIVNAVGSSPEAWSTTVSGDVCPVELSSAPPVDAEFWQPCLGSPVLTHGQGAPLPSPKQKSEPGPAQPCHSAILREGRPPAVVMSPPR